MHVFTWNTEGSKLLEYNQSIKQLVRVLSSCGWILDSAKDRTVYLYKPWSLVGIQLAKRRNELCLWSRCMLAVCCCWIKDCKWNHSRREFEDRTPSWSKDHARETVSNQTQSGPPLSIDLWDGKGHKWKVLPLSIKPMVGPLIMLMILLRFQLCMPLHCTHLICRLETQWKMLQVLLLCEEFSNCLQV